MSKFSNHLTEEKSPYLRQHVDSPIDWYPWGEEPFALAKELDCPVFLSIGYATCRWCQKMKNEAFSDPELASLMNDTFIAIKIDREELPHIDRFYMEFAQAIMSSTGGWPLNLVLTPDKKPFFAVSYLPINSSDGLMGLKEFAENISLVWKSEERDLLLEQADQLVELFKGNSLLSGVELPSEDVLGNVLNAIFEAADPIYGGTNSVPKFPMGYQIEFLLAIAKSRQESRAQFLAELTLDQMAKGGIYDQIGGGFLRYSVDVKWSIPHFEKMIFDNALLSHAYLQAWRSTKKETYKQIASKTLDYVMREMLQEDGSIASGEDADIEGVEGRYYSWSVEEVEEALSSSAETLLMTTFFGLTEKGNFQGKNVLTCEKTPEEFAKMKSLDEDKVYRRIEKCKEELFSYREKRKKPFKDQKMITSWSALMIESLLLGGLLLKNQSYIDGACRGLDFLEKHLYHNGKLFRRYIDGESRFEACLDDYACLIKTLLTFFEFGFGMHYLNWAQKLAKTLDESFKVKGGAYYFTASDGGLLYRKCEFYDGAEPSGNSVHLENLLRLYHLTDEMGYYAAAKDILRITKDKIISFAPGSCYLALGLFKYLEKGTRLVIALNRDEEHKEQLLEALTMHYSPVVYVYWKNVDDTAHRACVPIDQKTTLYAYKNEKCSSTHTDIAEMLTAISNA